MKKLLILLLIISLSAGLCACKARTGASSAQTKQKGARENVVIPENPRTEENTVIGGAEPGGGPEPEENPDEARNAAEEFLEAVKTGSKEKIQPYADYNALLRITQEQNAEWQFKQILPHMTYEVISAKIEDGAATVGVKISNVDMGVILPLWFEKVMRLEYDNALLDDPLDRDELDAEIKNIFAEILAEKANGRVETPADLLLEKTGDGWRLQNGGELGDALLGRYFSAYSGMAGNMMQSGEQPADYSGGEDVIGQDTDTDAAEE